MKRIGLAAVVLGLLGVAVWGLLVQFQTEKIETPPGSRSVVTFELVDRGIPATRLAAARALWSACVVDLGPAAVQPLEPTGDDRYLGVLSPSLDRFEERELRGCLNDLILPHVRGTGVAVTAPEVLERNHGRDDA